ncbi:MAG: type I restriction endonuclease, partial [Bradymonadaceae bacterium]
MSTPEITEVEDPFIEQLESMGWKHTTGNVNEACATGRESFSDVLLLEELRVAMGRINVDDEGKPWLDEGRLAQAISQLQWLGAHRLMEANQKATELLLSGALVDGVEGWDGGRARTVHFIDWARPENNTFRAINQFRVDEPGGQAHRYILPDIVLFVNGIPLVVVECKSPHISQPLVAAVEQLHRYSNQRGWLEGNEGNEKLFHTNQFVVGTCGTEARAGTIGASSVHFLEWKDTSPVPMSEVAESLGKTSLSSQEMLVAGMLRPEHLLDIVRHFTLFSQLGGKTIKIVCRYQQFRAAHLAVRRLLRGETRIEDGEHDHRGGLIWHTQGSGKSLTMVFLVRKMRSMPELRRFKVVIVTDRTDLQRQLSETAELSGDVVQIARSTAELKRYLSVSGPG